MDSLDALLYVKDSEQINETAAIKIQGMSVLTIIVLRKIRWWCIPPADPNITNFTVTPSLLTRLEAGCSDSVPHDNFTLVCNASKPALVLSQLEVFWLHNGTERDGIVSAENGGVFKTNTLHVRDAATNDSGSYECVARIMIPESPEVNITGSSAVAITGELPSGLLKWPSLTSPYSYVFS